MMLYLREIFKTAEDGRTYYRWIFENPYNGQEVSRIVFLSGGEKTRDGILGYREGKADFLNRTKINKNMLLFKIIYIDISILPDYIILTIKFIRRGCVL